MKKLMTMIAAVATAFGLYATDFTAHTIDFNSITEGNYNLSENTGTTGLYWSYNGQINGAYEATEELTVADGELTLNTSSKVLKRTFADLTDLAAPVPVDIDVEKGLYADMVLNLNNEILDTVPELDDSTKIAFFAMGGEDAAEVGLPVETNLYVYAAYDEGKALFKLMDDGKEFIAMNRRIAIKAYANVLASGTRTGFLIYAGDLTSTGDLNPVKVDEVYTLTDTTWTKVEFYEEKAGDYLGGIAVDATYSKWIALGQRSLFVSIDGSVAGNGALTSVEFKGRAKLASIELTDEDPGFASDGATMDINAEYASVTAVEGNGAMLINDDTAIFMPIANVVTATVAAASGYAEVTVKVGDLEISEIDGLAGKYEFTLDPAAKLSVKGWNAAATVGDKKFPYIFGDDPNTCAIAYVNANGGTLKLEKDVTALEEGDAFEFNGADVVLDLAGKMLTVLDGQALNNSGKLTIIDSATGGKIVGATENYSTLIISNGVFSGTVTAMAAPTTTATITIAGGTFDGKVSSFGLGGTETITAVGGKFLQKDDQEPPEDVNTEDAVKAFRPDDTYEVVDDEAGYWVVQERQVVEYTVTINQGLGTTLTVKNGDVDVEPGAKVADGTVLTITVAETTGYKNPKVTVNEAQLETPTGYYTVNGENVTIASSATEIQYATLTITQVENCTIVVKNAKGEDVQTGAEFDVDDAAKLTVTREAAQYYKLVGCEPSEEITMDESKTVTAAVAKETNLYYADLYVDGAKSAVPVQLGNGDHIYPWGEQVLATHDGVMVKPAFIPADGTWYVSKLVLKDGDQTWEFEYDGTTLAKTSGSDAVTIGENNVLSYTVTTGHNDCFGEVYLTKYDAPAPTPVIDPTKPSDPMDEDKAKDAAKAINDHPADYIKVPADFEGKITGDALTAYTGYFKAVVVPSAEADKFEVVLELNQAGSNKVATAEQTTDTTVLTTVLAATEATSMTVPTDAVIPGFYYSLKQGAAVTALGFKAGGDANKKGGVDTLTFELQKPENSGFYQMIVTPKPVDVPVGQ